MLWSLISSAYVIYLYRKLKAEKDPVVTKEGETGGAGGAFAGELDMLDANIRALEARLENTKAQEIAP